MKGLLIKDLRLMLQRKRSMLIILACGILMGFTTDGYFVVGWFLMIGALFALSTIAYDEYDNCYPFLITLPISRRDYAVEKFLFGMLSGLSFWILGILFLLVAHGAQHQPLLSAEDVKAFMVFLAIPLLILDFTIPVNLKYGSERSRVVLVILWGVIFAAVLLLKRFLPEGISFDPAILSAHTAALTAGGIAAVLLLTVLSVWLSIRVMRRKEF